MVPIIMSSKLQNEMLLDLARNLRQERLLIGSERQNLQILNQKVCTNSYCMCVMWLVLEVMPVISGVLFYNHFHLY